jgi:hypothetical protein
VPAVAIALAHNHPSGDPTPSPEELSMTQRLMGAGEVLGIQVLDHVILGDERFFKPSRDHHALAGASLPRIDRAEAANAGNGCIVALAAVQCSAAWEYFPLVVRDSK